MTTLITPEIAPGPYSAEPGPRTTFRNRKHFVSLAVLFALLALTLGCGLIGGGGDETEAVAEVEAEYGDVRRDLNVTNQDGESVAAYDVLTMVAKKNPPA